jgi:hypothetical protein
MPNRGASAVSISAAAFLIAAPTSPSHTQSPKAMKSAPLDASGPISSNPAA